MRKSLMTAVILAGMTIGSVVDNKELVAGERCYGPASASRNQKPARSWMFMRGTYSHDFNHNREGRRGSGRRTPFFVDERPVLGVAPDYLFGGLKYETIHPGEFRRIFRPPYYPHPSIHHHYHDHHYRSWIFMK